MFWKKKENLPSVIFYLKTIQMKTMASPKQKREEKQNHLSSLFHAFDVNNSGRIEKNKFSAICQVLQVAPQEAEELFTHLDQDKDGAVTLEEFLSCFKKQEEKEEGDDDGGGEEEENSSTLEEFSISIEQVIRWEVKGHMWYFKVNIM